MSITFTEAELDAIRSAAGRDGKFLKAYAHDVVVAAACSDHVAVIAASVANRSRELNERLARG